MYPAFCPFFSVSYKKLAALNAGTKKRAAKQLGLLGGSSPRQLLTLLSVALEASLTQLSHTSQSEDFLVEGTHGVYLLGVQDRCLPPEDTSVLRVVILLLLRQFCKCLVTISYL